VRTFYVQASGGTSAARLGDRVDGLSSAYSGPLRRMRLASYGRAVSVSPAQIRVAFPAPLIN
jgi:hypothetical protein